MKNALSTWLIFAAMLSGTLWPLITWCPGNAQALGSRQVDDDGLVGYWDFDEGSKTKLRDLSTFGNNGTIKGDPAYAPGICGNAMVFDGVDDLVQIPNSDSLNFGTGSFSFTFWVKLDEAPAGWSEILGKRIYDGHDYEIQFEAGGRINYIMGDPNNGYTRAFSTKTLGLHEFYMVTVVRTAGTVLLYLNDTLDSSDVSVQNVTSSSDLFFGKDPEFEEYLRATLDNVRIYRRALALSDVQALYASPGCKCDLQIGTSDITFNDGSPLEGSNLEVAAKVHNIGTKDAFNVDVTFYDDENEIGSTQLIDKVSALGGTKEVRIKWVAQPRGVHKISVRVDKFNSIEENDETNNEASKDLTILPPKLPDLIVTTGDIVFPTWPIVFGTTVNITATVNNLGEANANNVKVRFMDGSSQIGIDALITMLKGGGGSQTTTVQWTAIPMGEHTISVIADPENAIEETNETNNMASRTITLALPPRPDLSIRSSDIIFGSSPPVENNTIQIFAIVYNKGPVNAPNVAFRFFDGLTQIGADVTIPSVQSSGGLAQVSVQWTAFPAGNHTIKVLIDPDNAIDESNESNNDAERNITISANKTDVNHPPKFVTSPVTTAIVGLKYYYDSGATDEDGDPLTYTLNNAIQGMMIDHTTGAITWIPGAAQKGLVSVIIEVSDGRGGMASQPYTLDVRVVPPVCKIIYPTNGQTVKGTILVNGSAIKGAIELTKVQLRIDAGAWSDVNGTSSWNFALDTKSLAKGKHKLEAKAIDAVTESNITSIQFEVDNPIPMPPKEYKTQVEQFPWFVIIIITFGVCLVSFYNYHKEQKSRKYRY